MTKIESQPILWKHQLLVGLVVSALLFVACCLVEQTNFVAFYGSYALLIPVAYVFACWAAIGTGTLPLRLIAFSLMTPVLVISSFAGLTTNAYSSTMFFDGQTGWETGVLIIGMITFGLGVSCQIPFWVLRLVLGWRFTSKDLSLQSTKFSIMDLLLVTAIFALAFAFPNYAVDKWRAPQKLFHVI